MRQHSIRMQEVAAPFLWSVLSFVLAQEVQEEEEEEEEEEEGIKEMEKEQSQGQQSI